MTAATQNHQFLSKNLHFLWKNLHLNVKLTACASWLAPLLAAPRVVRWCSIQFMCQSHHRFGNQPQGVKCSEGGERRTFAAAAAVAAATCRPCPGSSAAQRGRDRAAASWWGCRRPGRAGLRVKTARASARVHECGGKRGEAKAWVTVVVARPYSRRRVSCARGKGESVRAELLDRLLRPGRLLWLGAGKVRVPAGRRRVGRAGSRVAP